MIAIKDKEFYQLVDFLQSRFGINMIKKRTLIESRLNNYLIANGFSDYETFLDYALSDKTGYQLNQIINRLTTNYSYFMREWDHFEYFKSSVLPDVANRIKEKDLRIWSAGCSTGQEPYTLAMLIADYFGQQKPGWNTQLLATDISQNALEKAVRGEYEDECLKNVPSEWMRKYFNKQTDDNWQIKKAIKNEVIFRRFNLMEPQFPFKRKFHVIFCRNVMIYFNRKTKEELVEKFYDATEPGGYLFVGQSETLDKNSTRYQGLKPSIYRKGV